MHSSNALPDLSGRRALVPGRAGGVGEGVVRGHLAAGADVVVPTRTQERAEEFRAVLGEAATDRLHLLVHDYTTFAGAEQLAEEMERRLGGVDDVVAPIGGWWADKRLSEIDEADWQLSHAPLNQAITQHRSSVPAAADGANRSNQPDQEESQR